ncbi:hypothetical protein [Bacillus sp. AFS017336]|uniref:hypothetical protein n=1 Tax=Bacillus sp. AFS017336 TaxID=2033489 RepID=UPI000BF0E935|nr:hypothetical protein [Bacillus sp. AFS017336]PEL14058.1 hypothetical protein CN601_02135 [Bacillus sp. AFS017336]
MNNLKTIFSIEWKRMGIILLFTLVVVTKWSEHDYDFYFWLVLFSLIISIFVAVFNVTQIYKRTDL